MKKIKITLGLLVVVFVALVIYQNREYFLAKQALIFILVPEKFQWTAPEVQNVAFFGGCLAIGILIAGYLGLVSKFRSMKSIKQLNKTIVSQVETIESLKAELENFKAPSNPDNLEKSEENLSSNNALPNNETPLLKD
ncbi:MAG: hypothetical protein HQK64_08910 [Desulfamplus sp.]|nr:hypothetical protein [Desulfamplus sp.]MBF0210416.1 hypothetical protein [Desulfamplus sp.]MBF0242581.1 hypothetical protein [Desulfamplus sp.]